MSGPSAKIYVRKLSNFNLSLYFARARVNLHLSMWVIGQAIGEIGYQKKKKKKKEDNRAVDWRFLCRVTRLSPK